MTVEDYASLPATGEANTIYRVANWDGSLETPAVDITKYSEYAWNGTEYVFLSVKSQIGEVYDISAANSGATYVDLAEALGTNGDNVPAAVRKGGMTIQFVLTSDNKYVQCRYMGTSITDASFANVANWQGIDDEPTAGSKNLVKSGGIAQTATFIENALYNKMNMNSFIKELFIVGMQSNVTYYIRTLRIYNNYVYFYIKGTDDSTVEILTKTSDFNGILTKTQNGLSVYVVLKNIDKTTSKTFITGNSNPSICTINQFYCGNIDFSPSIKQVFSSDSMVSDVSDVMGCKYINEHFTTQGGEIKEMIHFSQGEKLRLFLTNNKTGIGTYVYFRTNSDDESAVQLVKLPEKDSYVEITAVADINYISVNATSSQFDISGVTDWHRDIIVIKNIGNHGIYKNEDDIKELQTKVESYESRVMFNGFPIPKNPSALKILCIGNSYIQEPVKALIDWLGTYELTNVLFAFTYHAGAAISGYNSNFETNWCCFSYSENGNAFKTINIATGEDSPLSTDAYVNTPKQAVEWTDWDIILFQQGSGSSDNVESLDDFDSLLQKVRYNCSNSGAKFAWHMTWAWAATYPSITSHGGQDAMYQGIVEVAKKVESKYGLDLIVPSGTVMQNLRSVSNNYWGNDLNDVTGITEGSEYGDFTRDGSHPSDYADYAITASIMQTLILPSFNKTILGSTATYSYATSGRLADMAIQCALKAVNNRYEVSIIDET